MAIMTQGFQIRWVIAAAFAKFKNMVTVAFLIGRRLLAILANTTIAHIDVLFQPDPQRRLIVVYSPIPGEAITWKFIYRESCHTLPCLTTPRIAAQSLTLPSLSSPHPYHKRGGYLDHALPHRTSPDQTPPRQTSPPRALPRNARSRRSKPSPQGAYL